MGRGEGAGKPLGEVGEPADRVCSQEPYILQSPGPSRPEPTPIVHVVLVRLVSRETATSKQHRAQLISTQTFSGQADFKWERLTPTGNSSGRSASLCAWVRGWPRSCRMGGPGGEVTGAEDPPAGSGDWQHSGAAPCWGTRVYTHVGSDNLQTHPTSSFQCRNSSLAETDAGKSRASQETENSGDWRAEQGPCPDLSGSW